MVKSSRFFLLFIAAFFLIIYLVGCATVDVETEDDSGETSQESETDTTDDDTSETEVQEQEDVELVMYSWRSEDRAAYETFIDRFQEIHPHISITFEPFQSTEYNTILNNALVSGSGPDIIQLRPYEGAKSIADNDYLVPLDDVPGINDINEDFLLAASGSDGNVYGVPLALNAAVIWYNEDIFEEYNIDVPETWDQFINVSETLLENGVTPIAQSGRQAYVLSLMHGALAPPAYGGNELVDDILAGEADLHDPRFVESVKRMEEIVRFFPDDFIALDDQDAQRLFYSEQAAMYINGSYRLETFQNNAPDMNIGVIPSLAAEEGGPAPVTTWVDGSYGVVKNSEHQEEAKLFMEFMATEEFGQMFSDELNRLGAISGVTPSHPIVNDIGSAVDEGSTPYLMLVHFGSGSPTGKTVFEDHLQGMYLGEVTVEEVIEEAQKAADRAAEEE